VKLCGDFRRLAAELTPQPRPAPTVRALPVELAAQRGPFWMPIRGPNPTPIDTYHLLNGTPLKDITNIEDRYLVGKERELASDFWEHLAQKRRTT
jgi:hypothetical protein